jgi:hypothetical protein
MLHDFCSPTTSPFGEFDDLSGDCALAAEPEERDL